MQIKKDTKDKLKSLTKDYRSNCRGLPAENIPDAIEYLLAFWLANEQNLYIKRYPVVSYKYDK
jgi:mRNA deadenylase 3'-5' endonuclease subunit Ccr4